MKRINLWFNSQKPAEWTVTPSSHSDDKEHAGPRVEISTDHVSILDIIGNFKNW